MGTSRSGWTLAGLVIGGLLVGSLSPPEGLGGQAWHLLVLFLTTITGVVVAPRPLSVIALVAGLVAVLLHILSLQEILGEFGSKVVWLIVLAFFIARGFVKTGLGRRIALHVIRLLGRSTLGLGYGLTLTEFVLSPAIPSVTARSGAVVFPIAKSVAEDYSAGATSEERSSLTAYLMSVCFHANVITCAMFLTAMAGNPLAVQLAAQKGVQLTWGTWALGAIVPGLVSLALLPWVLQLLLRPAIRSSSAGLKAAQEACTALGPMTAAEWKMLGVFLLLLIGWIGEPWFGYDATTVALTGVVILLLTQVISWKDAVAEQGAWDTLVWFAVLLALTTALTKYDVIAWLDHGIEGRLEHLQWPMSGLLLIPVYFFLHYLFTSATAHISALYMGFFGVLIYTGAPPLLTAVVLAYFASLAASLTHYGNASAPIYFQTHVLSVAAWWRAGGCIAIGNLLIWGTLGSAWWDCLGWLHP